MEVLLGTKDSHKNHWTSARSRNKWSQGHAARTYPKLRRKGYWKTSDRTVPDNVNRVPTENSKMIDTSQEEFLRA